VVTEELHQNGELHHHLFLRTLESFTRLDIKLMIATAYNMRDDEENENNSHNNDDDDNDDDAQFINESSIYVATVRNIHNYLGYITKEDQSPLFKGRGLEKSFSFYYRSIAFANSVSEFDVTHPFVLNHPQFYKLLNEVVVKTKDKKRKIAPYKSTKACITLCNRSMQLARCHTRMVERLGNQRL
jgi:hypothetical protein